VTPLYPQKLALTSPTGGGRSVGIVRSRTKAMEFFYHCYYMLHFLLNINYIHIDFVSVKFIGCAEPQVFSPVKCVISGCIFTSIILRTKRILTSKVLSGRKL
jgi:hypothetical protein